MKTIRIMKIKGGKNLSGLINISGAKNSAVALVPASILCDEEVTIENVPMISDIDALKEILTFLNAETETKSHGLVINSKNLVNKEVPKVISAKLRASYYFMSALLGRFKKVEMYFPGGCNIGARPIDQTLKGYRALGAKVIELEKKFIITADELIGARIKLDMPSVGATVNIMLASVKAKGKTIIENAAKEPEIVNVAELLNNMGAKITGVGTSEITIEGVDYLKSATVRTIPDRIETGTYVILGALAGKSITVNNVIPSHIESLTSKLIEMGADIKINENSIEINRVNDLSPINVKTLGYPGFPTDLQQPMSVLLTQCTGTSLVEETIYESRFGHVPYLQKMGAVAEVHQHFVKFTGKSNLHGTEVTATDLRAGASMVLAGLIAQGETVIKDVEHILRGYENIVEKLVNIGADITIEEIQE